MLELEIVDLINKLERHTDRGLINRCKPRSVTFQEYEISLLLDLLKGKLVKTPTDVQVEQLTRHVDKLIALQQAEVKNNASFRERFDNSIIANILYMFFSLKR